VHGFARSASSVRSYFRVARRNVSKASRRGSESVGRNRNQTSAMSAGAMRSPKCQFAGIAHERLSLARLLASQGRRDEACTMLAEIYNWFTEGFDTADLKGCPSPSQGTEYVDPLPGSAQPKFATGEGSALTASALRIQEVPDGLLSDGRSKANQGNVR